VAALAASKTETASVKADQKDPWLRTYFTTRLAALDRDRTSYMPTWRDLQQNFSPRRGRFLFGQESVSRGRRRDQRVIDNTPLTAARDMSSGMHSGITSPARPWVRFRVRVANDKLNNDGEVKAWLDEVQRRVLYVFAKSNLYNALHTLYGELGVFGTGVLWVDEDEEDIVRGYTMTVGEYWLASSNRQIVDTIYRSFWWSVRQIVDTFGRDNVSLAIRANYDSGQLDQEYEIVHAIEPNPNHNPRSARLPLNSAFPWGGTLASELPFRSVWFERAATGENGLLRVSGYEEFPVMAPRWALAGNETYGSDSPGWVALGDGQQLQVLQRRSMELVDKLSKPPMVAHPAMRAEPMSQLPGGVTFDPDVVGKGYRAAYEIKPEAVAAVDKKIEETGERVKKAFYADLWLMMTEDERRQPATAREVDERHEEKMLMLGPVLERLHDELLEPLVTRVYNIMVRNGLLPPMPAAIRGAHVQIEFISMLALAQKALTTGPIERLWQFGSQIGAVKPEAYDRLDADGTLDNYADMIGAPASVLVDLKKAQAMRQARAKQQQQQVSMEQLGQFANAAKVASGIDVGGGRNAVQAMVGGGA
jgi:hypothetical protein